MGARSLKVTYIKGAREVRYMVPELFPNRDNCCPGCGNMQEEFIEYFTCVSGPRIDIQ